MRLPAELNGRGARSVPDVRLNVCRTPAPQTQPRIFAALMVPADLVQRQFQAERPDRLRVSDFTYVATRVLICTGI
jgi:hypothetical protein